MAGVVSEMMEDEWVGCYGEAWGADITAESVCHPAKFSRALIRRIYQHCADEGWIERGEVRPIVVDPFGGVALGALEAMRLGCNWVGCELEPKFVALAQQNIDLWNSRYSGLPRWGSARIVQGDSRFMARVIEAANLQISSPPYGVGTVNASNGIDTTKLAEGNRRFGPNSQAVSKNDYGSSSGQLDRMPEGSVDVAISSPPFQAASVRDRCRVQGGEIASNILRAWTQDRQGTTAGNLAAMPPKKVDVFVSSPPYESRVLHEGGPSPHQGGPLHSEYGHSNGQLADAGDDFWSASRTILEQTHSILRPGAHACFVVKRFCRNGATVDFPGQWARLCEAVGFELVHHHRAMLVEDRGTQMLLEGGEEAKTVSRKSFFRRIYETKYPENRIDYEDVLCFRIGRGGKRADNN